MNCRSLFCAFLFCFPFAAPALAQVGAVLGVHDPRIIRSNGQFYLFSTGPGIEIPLTWKDSTHQLLSRP
jgi:hypothetical protein